MQCRVALDALGTKFNEVAPDAVVILGNDQREFFNAGLTPAITIYRGSQISNVQHLNEDAPGLNIAEPANSPAEGATYPGATALADHILRSLGDENFDLAQSDQTPSGAPRGGIPHAYGFFYHTILQDQTPPSVPIILNVHFPHNTPKLHRCLELGRGLYRAITTLRRLQARGADGVGRPDALRDRRGLRSVGDHRDEDRRRGRARQRCPRATSRSARRRSRTGIPVIAAMNAAGRYHQVDYVPCYRSEAGTGNAMCFAYWSRRQQADLDDGGDLLGRTDPHSGRNRHLYFQATRHVLETIGVALTEAHTFNCSFRRGPRVFPSDRASHPMPSTSSATSATRSTANGWPRTSSD